MKALPAQTDGSAGLLNFEMQVEALVGLDRDDERVGLDSTGIVRLENRRWRLAERDCDLAQFPRQAFAGVQIEGNAIPAQICDLELERHESLHRGVVGHAGLLAVTRDLIAVDVAAGVLAQRHVLRADGGDRLKGLRFFVADAIGVEG